MYVKSENLTLNDIFYNRGVTMAKKLLDIMRDKIRVKHYPIKTENVYIYIGQKNIYYFIINDILILWVKKSLKNIYNLSSQESKCFTYHTESSLQCNIIFI